MEAGQADLEWALFRIINKKHSMPRNLISTLIVMTSSIALNQ